MTLIYLLLLVSSTLTIYTSASRTFDGISGIYCGQENCYDVLGANRETATKEELAKLYRNLARRWHPDRFIWDGESKRAEVTEKFRQIATAYEVLRDDESRRDYNAMLDDPEQSYRHYYRYYKRVYGTNRVDAQWVILGLITGLSLVQYFAMQLRHKQLISEFASTPKYRFRAQVMAKRLGLLPILEKRMNGCDHDQKEVIRGRRRQSNKSRGEKIREQEEIVIRQMIGQQMEQMGFVKPNLSNTLWIQIIRAPVSVYRYIYWYLRWLYLFKLKGVAYGEEEKIYLISKHLGLGCEELNNHEDYDINCMLKQELWNKEKFAQWKQQHDQEISQWLAESSSYKRHMRYLKKGGPGQITFVDSD